MKRVLEAALLSTPEPLTVQQLKRLFAGELDVESLRKILDELKEEWAERSVELTTVASGWRFRVKPDYQKYLDRISSEKPPRYSRAVLETLAIIAYRQPVTRGDIEDIRGVAVSPPTLKALEERGWIDVVGHRETPGRPALFATTRKFLDDLNLRSLEELPALEELQSALDATLDAAPAIPVQEALLGAPEDEADVATPTPEAEANAPSQDTEHTRPCGIDPFVPLAPPNSTGPAASCPEWAKVPGGAQRRGKGGKGARGGKDDGKRERLQKVMAQSGHGSRRNIEILIAQGHITINGQVAKLGDLVGPGDRVKLDGKLISLRFGAQLPRVLLYHKPEGEICTRDDPEGRPTVFAKLPEGEQRALGVHRPARLQHERAAHLHHQRRARQPPHAPALRDRARVRGAPHGRASRRSRCSSSPARASTSTARSASSCASWTAAARAPTTGTTWS